MLNVNNIKNGMSIIINDGIYFVISAAHSKSGRGQAHVKAKIKNWNTGAITTYTFSGKERVEQAVIQKTEAQFIYKSGTNYVFLDQTSFEEIQVPEEAVEWEKDLLVEGDSIVEMVSYSGKILGVSLPAKVSLKVTMTEPAVRGDTISGATKKALLESGIEINVPLFIKIGDYIFVNSEDKKYSSKDSK